MAPPNQELPLHVMVIGAGSAGLLVAQSLKKAGISFAVFEQDAGIDARPRDWNFGIYWAELALKKCLPEKLNDLLHTAQVDNYTPTAQDTLPVYSGETGEKMTEIPTPFQLRLGRRKFIKLISAGINIRYGKRIVDIESRGSKVTATFEDGTQHTADLLIGCDGAHSRTREFLLGAEKAAVTLSPLVASIAITKLPASSVELIRKLHPRFCIWFHPKGYFSWIGVQDSSNKPNIEDWDFALSQTWIHEAPLLTGDDILKDLKRRAEEFPEPYKTIYQSIPEGTRVWHFRLTYWTPMPWDNRRGTVTLVGDSAHPMTMHRGQGFNNGIIDAASLCQKLASLSSTTREAISAAITEYEKDLWERGKEAVEVSLRNSMEIHDWQKLLRSPLFRDGLSQNVTNDGTEAKSRN